jgi:hypothetical protein
MERLDVIEVDGGGWKWMKEDGRRWRCMDGRRWNRKEEDVRGWRRKEVDL